MKRNANFSQIYGVPLSEFQDYDNGTWQAKAQSIVEGSLQEMRLWTFQQLLLNLISCNQDMMRLMDMIK